jgi:DNA-binding FadR family transcriptional regulator
MHGRVVEWLGRRIVSGELTDGSQLPNEAQLAAQLNVSRGGVREAIKALAAKGLVEARPRLGTRVLPRDHWNLMDREVLHWRGGVDRHFLDDLLDLRAMVEPGAAERAAQLATEEQVRELANALAGMERNAPGLPDTGAAFVDADVRFHLTVFRASGNQLIEHLGRLLETSLHHGLEASSRAPGGVAAALPHHRAVLDAVKRGRPRAANSAMRRLLETTRQMVDEGRSHAESDAG